MEYLTLKILLTTVVAVVITFGLRAAWVSEERLDKKSRDVFGNIFLVECIVLIVCVLVIIWGYI